MYELVQVKLNIIIISITMAFIFIAYIYYGPITKNMISLVLKWLNDYWLNYKNSKILGSEVYRELKLTQKEKTKIDKMKKKEIDKSFTRFKEYIYIIINASNKAKFNFTYQNEDTHFSIEILNSTKNPCVIFSWPPYFEKFYPDKHKNASDTVKEFIYSFEEEIIEFLKKECLEHIKTMKEEINKNKDLLDKKEHDEYYVAAEKELREYLNKA